jgi:ABC-2 type transport system ATP-binding protein
MRGLEVHSVSWRYGRKVVLDGVSLAVPRGTFCALLGPNGAGKTTLFSIATRLLPVRAGSVTVDGISLAENPRAVLARLGIVFQQPTLDPGLSVRRNLTYFGALHGLSARETMSRAAPLMERLGLAARLGDKAHTLNGGHRRRLEIARALLHDPCVLLLDEPTVGLDVASRRAIVDHVHALCQSLGLAVLWATHLVDEVRPTDLVVLLHEGRVVAHGTASDVVAGTGASDLAAAFARLTGGAPADLAAQ